MAWGFMHSNGASELLESAILGTLSSCQVTENETCIAVYVNVAGAKFTLSACLLSLGSLTFVNSCTLRQRSCQ